MKKLGPLIETIRMAGSVIRATAAAGSAMVLEAVQVRVGHRQELWHHPDHAGGRPGRRPLDDRIEPVLRREPLPNIPVDIDGAGADDGPVVREAGVHQPVQIDRHMRPVEFADTELHDPGRELIAAISRTANSRRNLFE